MAPGKEKNIAGGTGGQKTGPLFSRVPRGYPFRGELGPVYPKKYRRGYFTQKIPGTMWYPGFPEKYQWHACHGTWSALYFGKFNFTLF